VQDLPRTTGATRTAAFCGGGVGSCARGAAGGTSIGTGVDVATEIGFGGGVGSAAMFTYGGGIKVGGGVNFGNGGGDGGGGGGGGGASSIIRASNGP